MAAPAIVPKELGIREFVNADEINMRDVYLPIADVVAIYDNSDEGRVLIAEQEPGVPLIVHDAVRWAMIERASQ